MEEPTDCLACRDLLEAYHRERARGDAAEQVARMNGATLSCAYCGWVADWPGVIPAAELLLAHQRACERHPLRKAEAELAKEKAANLEWLRLARAVYHATTEEAERAALYDLREHSKGCGWADLSPPLAQLLCERAERAEAELASARPCITVSQMQREAWQNAEEKGFHQGRGAGRDDTLLRLCLVHSEVSEAVQLVKRKWTDNPLCKERDDLAEELADVLIRCGDLAGCLKLDLDAAVRDKLARNKARPRLYGTPAEGRTGP